MEWEIQGRHFVLKSGEDIKAQIKGADFIATLGVTNTEHGVWGRTQAMF